MKWFVDMWNTYKEVIMPILLSIVGFGGTFLIVYIRNILAKYLADKSDQGVLISHIKDKIEKAASNEEVQNIFKNTQALVEKLAATQEQNKLLSEMITVAFEGSNLTPDLKNEIKSIGNKIKYETEEKVVSVLEEQLKIANDKIKALEVELNEPDVVEEVVEEKENKRVRL